MTVDIGQIVDDLFSSRMNPDTRLPYTYVEAANRMAAFGYPVDSTTLRKIRQGQVSNPSRMTIAGLCLLFNVSPQVFFPDVPSHQVAPLAQALEATGLDATARSYLLGLIEYMRTQQR